MSKPTHHLSVVTGDGDAARFTQIAPLWPTKSGTGYTGTIPAGVTITGRVVITEAKAADNGGAQ